MGALGGGGQAADVVAHPVDLVFGTAVPSFASVALLDPGELCCVHPSEDRVYGVSYLVEVVSDVGAVTVGGGIHCLLGSLSGSFGSVPHLSDL